MTTHDYSETSNARRIPVELANAREACTQTWNRYFVVIEREHTYEEYHQALNEAGAADDLCSDLYRRWQAVGGTSDIESIEAAERFLNLVEVALTHAETIAVVPAWQIDAKAQAADANDWDMQTNELRNG